MDRSFDTEIRQILARHRLADRGLRIAAGFANAVALTDAHAIRLNDGRFAGAFRFEAAVLAQLPPEVPHAAVIACGERERGGEYLVLERLPGRDLHDAWADMTPDARDHVFARLGEIVAALHALPAAPWMRNPWVEAAIATGTWRDAYHAPPSCATAMIAAARTRRPDLDTLLDEVTAFVAARIALFGDAPDVFVHADVHVRNVIVAGESITGIIDFEGARLAPAETELDMLVRSLLDREDGARSLAAFREGYPALFAGPNLVARLEVLEVLWHLVQIHHWVPGATWTTDPGEALRDVVSRQFGERVRRLLAG